MVRLESMEAFVKVVDAGGLSAAGRRLKISPTMVSNHVVALETALGARLLNRTTRSQSLTDAGRMFYARCVDVLERVHSAEDEINSRRGTVSGCLRVAVPGALGMHLLTPLISDLTRRHPGLDVELQLIEREVNLVEEGFDAVIRLAPVDEANMVARQLRTFPRWVVASPAYLKRRSAPQRPEQIADHPCIVFRGSERQDVWRFVAPRKVDVTVHGRMVVNSFESVLVAVRENMGLAMVPQYVAESAEAKSLVRLLPGFELHQPTAWLYYLQDRMMSARSRVFIDLVIERYGLRVNGAGP